MTPAARIAAAIALLDSWSPEAGEPAEAALTRWARGARFAGSSDREAVRDLVFTAIRCARSSAAYGGAHSGGRARMLGLLREAGRSPEGWTGEGHAPAPLSPAESDLMALPLPELPRAVALDLPDWLLPHFEAALGADTDAVLAALRERAPVFLRVNRRAGSASAAIEALATEGITAAPHPLSETALELGGGARRLRNARAFHDGLVEPQDAASQAVVDCFAARLAAHHSGPVRVLDYCAGGGGKALALAAHGHRVTAHDADPGRMRDLPARASRAGLRIAVDMAPKPGWPAVLADVPCSGSGAWRRSPEAKWRLTPDRLAELVALQAGILTHCAGLVAPGGLLAYATCSLLDVENDTQIKRFIAENPGWAPLDRLRLTSLDGGDGFFLQILQKS